MWIADKQGFDVAMRSFQGFLVVIDTCKKEKLVEGYIDLQHSGFIVDAS